MKEFSKKQIDHYLKEVETYLNHITLDQKIQILSEIKHDIEKKLEENEENLTQVLKTQGSPSDIANRYLMASGLKMSPKAKRKSLFRTIFLILFGLFIISLIALAFLIKQITPIFDFDGENGVVTLFGGKIVMEESEESFLNNTRVSNLKTNTNNVKVKGSFPVNDFQKFDFIGSDSHLRVTLSHEGELVYDCTTIQESEKFEIIQNSLVMNFSKGSQCLIKIPKDIPINIKINNGMITIDEIEQNFEAVLRNGVVRWKKGPRSFKYRAEVDNGRISGEKVSRQGQYQGYVQVANGKIIIH